MGKVRIGETIAGMYRVERVLGTGGMGVVVAARHLELGWLCAVKIMHPDPTGKQTWTHRFRREAQVGGRLGSEHVARIFDVGGFDEGRPYIVMEHLEGIDLGKLLRTRGPRPMDEAALFVWQACDAVAEAHDMGVVHRDLKPANLFVITGADGRPSIKVLDFGISKAGILADKNAIELTQTGDVFGSPAYMAPEQIRRFAGAGPRSDVWSLGVILYELVTGRWPFPGKASVEMIAMVLDRAPDPPSRHRPGLPPAFEAVVLQCLEKDPERRMPSARALRDALAPFLPSPHLLRTIGDDVPTTVAPPKRKLPVPPAPAPALAEEPVDSARSPLRGHPAIEITALLEPADIAPPMDPIDVAPPSGTQTTAQPIIGVQHTLPPANAEQGPSKRVVALVAAASIAIITVTFTALVRRAAPPVVASVAPAAPAEVSAASAEESASAAEVAPPAAPSIAPAEPTASATASSNELAPAANPLDPVSLSPANPDPPAQPAPSSNEPLAARSSAAEAPGGRAPAKPAASSKAEAREGGGRQVDQVAALNALAGAAVASKRCKKPGGPTGAARVEVTFGPSGAVSSVRIGGPFDGTPVGKCIVSVFRGASVPPFVGSSFSASKTVSIK